MCKILKKSGRPVCGDLVEFDPVGLTIQAILPRTSALIRPDSTGKVKPLAANVDQFVIVAAVAPTPDINLIDRYLVAAENIHAEAILVLNKVDLVDDRDPPLADVLLFYTTLGYPLLLTSEKDASSDQALLALLAKKTSILLGQSGVGKSSLVNRLLVDSAIRVGELSHYSGAGCHTTTTTTCYDLPAEGYLIDSPGVRAFRLWNLSFNELEYGYREFRPFLGECRFNNCRHISEPNCAVIQAVHDGKISAERFQRFQMIAASLDSASFSN